MTYGAETWTLPERQKRELAAAQCSMERSMLNITRGNIRNKTIRSITKVKDIIEQVRTIRGKWAGHLARMNDIKWAKRTTEWTPRQGKRRRGKPKRRWRDEIQEVGGRRWMQVAQDRRAWRKLWRPVVA